MLVSWSNVPEAASRAAQMLTRTIEVTGTRECGLKRPKAAKNNPSRAAAYGTRARARIVPLSAPVQETRKIRAAMGAACVPRKVCTVRAATEGASGYAVELEVAICQKGNAHRDATLMSMDVASTSSVPP